MLAAAPFILGGGFRMSAQGQGDGGVYFSTLGPSSYNLGSRDYEDNIIIDCFGKERLEEYKGKHKLDVLFVYGLNPKCVEQAPGGRENAKVVPKAHFSDFSAPLKDGKYFLRQDYIKAVFLLDGTSGLPKGLNDVVDGMAQEKENDFEVQKLLKECEQALSNNAASAKAVKDLGFGQKRLAALGKYLNEKANAGAEEKQCHSPLHSNISSSFSEVIDEHVDDHEGYFAAEDMSESNDDAAAALFAAASAGENNDRSGSGGRDGGSGCGTVNDTNIAYGEDALLTLFGFNTPTDGMSPSSASTLHHRLGTDSPPGEEMLISEQQEQEDVEEGLAHRFKFSPERNEEWSDKLTVASVLVAAGLSENWIKHAETFVVNGIGVEELQEVCTGGHATRSVLYDLGLTKFEVNKLGIYFCENPLK